MKKFSGRCVTVRLGDLKLLEEVDDIPNSIYSKFPIIDKDKLDESYTFDNIGMVTYFRFCDCILDYDEYINKDIIELYNIIDELSKLYDRDDLKKAKIIRHNISDIKQLISTKEKEYQYKK